MHTSTSRRRKSFGLYALASAALVGLGAVAALMAGITPAAATNIAAQADTQVAVFMVPLTILVVAILFEATRIVVRGTLPVEAATKPGPRISWPSGQAEH